MAGEIEPDPPVALPPLKLPVSVKLAGAAILTAAFRLVVWAIMAAGIAAVLFVLYIPVHFIIKYW